MAAAWDRMLYLVESGQVGSTGEVPPLYGEPGPLDDFVLHQLVLRVAKKWQSDPRKREQALRERMLDSRHGPDVEDYIDKLYKPSFARRLTPHVTAVANLFADVTKQVVQLYRGQTLRRIDRATEAEQAAFQRLVRETMVTATAQRMAEVAWGVGPQHVIPEVRRNRMRLLAPTPSTTDEVLDVEDPTGDPVAVGYPSGKGQVTVVDGESHRTFEVRGDRVRELEDERRIHGIGDSPASTLRFAEPTEACDYHMRDRNRRIVEANLVVGHLLAKLSHVRKGQGGWLLTVVGNIDGIARGQKIGDPVTPIVARNDNEGPDSPRETKFDTLEFDTSPENYTKHIRLVTEFAAESTGIPVHVTAGDDRFDMEFDFDRLTEHREELVWWAETWERALWTYVVLVAKASRWPGWRDLPSPEKIEDGFYLQLPRLHRKFANPQEERKDWEWRMKYGMASFIDLGRRFMGNRPDRAIAKQIAANIAINGKVWDEIAKRQAPAMLGDRGEVQTLAQAQGALGPAVRDGRAPPPGGDGENEDEAEAGS